MQKILQSSLQLTFGLLFLAVSAHAEPMLNGLALHQELGKDQFIGAIYSETLAAEANSLLSSQESITMELKITAERGIRARRFNRMWIEGMAINNSSSSLSSQADNMVAFTNFFKGRLLQNDHIVFSAAPNKGLDVSINTVKLGNIADDSFIHMLLSTWIGRVPLSSDYQGGVLAAGAVDDALFQRFSGIEPSESRIQQIVAWNAPPEPTPAPKVAAVEPKVAPKPVAIASTDKVSIALPSLDETSSETSSVSSSSAKSIAATSVASSVASKDAAPVLSDEALALARLDEEEDEEDNNLPAFTAESLLANQLYFSSVNLLVQRNITYPRRAVQKGHTGNLRIAITLNRKGELLEATFLEKTPYNALNNAAMKTVSKLTYPEIPEVILGSTHNFSIPISFKLQ